MPGRVVVVTSVYVWPACSGSDSRIDGLKLTVAMPTPGDSRNSPVVAPNTWSFCAMIFEHGWPALKLPAYSEPSAPPLAPVSCVLSKSNVYTSLWLTVKLYTS